MRIPTCQVGHESAAQKSRLLHFVDGWTTVERVGSYSFDGIEHGQSASAEHLHIHASAPIHHFCQRPAFGEEGAGSDNEIFHQPNVTFIKAPFNNVVLGKPVHRSTIERNVYAANVQVARNILPEVRELQRGAGSIGQTLTLLVAVAAEIQDQAPHRICRIQAIAEDSIPIRVALNSLVPAESFQEISKRLSGNILCDDCLA